MTALKKYQKLECTGLWRSAPEDQRREVLVNFGEASLTMSDPGSELALSHWSLPAVERLNPGERPALYGPGADAEETLELDDSDMIAALDTVQWALRAALPRPGRLRTSALLGLGGTVLLVGLFWLPGALVRHTAAVVPPATRAEIGALALKDIMKLTGKPCDARLGRKAIDRLVKRVFGPERVEILVVRDGVREPVHLPDGQILLGRTLVEKAEGPDLLAGYALAEKLRSEREDPLVPLLHHAGIVATFRLLTTGALPPDAVNGYGSQVLLADPAPLPEEVLAERFTAAEIPARAYAFAVDPSGESTLALIEADELNHAKPRAVLPDEDWVSLQEICID